MDNDSIPARERPIPFHRLPQAIDQLVGVRPNLSTCYRWRARGAINAFHIGGRCFVHADEVRRFINSRNGGRAN